MDAFFSSTTFHGVYQVRFLKRNTARILFLLVILGSYYAMITQVITLAKAFMDNPVSSSVDIIDMSSDIAMKLPLTVCMRDWVSKRRTELNNYSSSDVAAILGVLQVLPEFNTSVEPSKTMMNILRKTNKTGFARIIRSIMKPYPMGEEHGEFRVNNPGHLCLEYEPEVKPSFSSAGGMITHFDVPKFLDDTHEIQMTPFTSEGYVQWTMYHLDEGPLPVLLENKLYDLSVNIVMQNIELKNYKQVLQCTDDTHKLIVPSGYLTRRCNQKCIQNHVIAKLFNCFIPAFSDSKTLNVCVLPEIVPQYMNRSFFNHFNNWQIKQNEVIGEIQDCITRNSCTKKEKCDTWRIKALTLKEDRRQVNGDVIHFALQFAEDIEVVETTPIYSWETMISYLGGQWGLWMGASSISFFHLFYSICESAYQYIAKKIRSHRKMNSDVVIEIGQIKN